MNYFYITTIQLQAKECIRIINCIKINKVNASGSTRSTQSEIKIRLCSAQHCNLIHPPCMVQRYKLSNTYHFCSRCIGLEKAQCIHTLSNYPLYVVEFLV